MKRVIFGVSVIVLTLLVGCTTKYSTSDWIDYRDELPENTLRIEFDRGGFIIKSDDSRSMPQSAEAIVAYLETLNPKPAAIALLESKPHRDLTAATAILQYALEHRIRVFHVGFTNFIDPDNPRYGDITELTDIRQLQTEE